MNRLNEYEEGYRVSKCAQLVTIDMIYPRTEGHVNEVEVGIECVRASDSIKVSFDYDRNGYSIKQASRFSFTGDEAERDEDWQEVAFVDAWGRKESEEEEELRLWGKA